MFPRGAIPPADTAPYPVVSSFAALGHIIQDDGTTSQCWQATRAAMWRAFFANAGGGRGRKLGTRRGIVLNERAVGPVLDFRCSRWPFYERRAKEIARVQRAMTSIVMGVRRMEGEDPGEFVRRRHHREAGRIIARTGSWASRWAKRVVEWDQHVARPRNGATWAAVLRPYRDEAWLQRRRAEVGSARASGGRLLIRANSGFVATRWHAGVVAAAEHLRISASTEGV
eukprot:CAMPEP_0198530264 /NCGR_PEP_ID=MMETSP1462-20131121/26250_1 /TAXON_ID=1333877 /ORGANISM="Brandtodinium nutriculum, Strain RCC3387" /LENGTH=226 /DNA_ID=CAMNT_0044260135 /DNA_START=17 /DNA_END=697 /DNA_ORIENTATION=-